MPLNIPPEFERAILERVQSGEYASTDDVLLACLDALEAEENEREARRERMRRGLDAPAAEVEGETIDSDEALARAIARLRERAGSVLDEGTDPSDDDVEALRREIQIGLDELDRGEGIPGEEAFAQSRAAVRRRTGREPGERTNGSVSLPAALESFVNDEVGSGRYNSASEVVEAGLRLLQEEEEDLEAQIEELGRKLQVGIDQMERGEGIPADEAEAMIRRWYEEDEP
jgi:antitoxin ParD1/3/4